jgi:hypothetical protein
MTEIYYQTSIVCPHCASIHECATRANGESGAPEDGNLNICFRCERMSIYDRKATGGLRPATSAEIVEAMQAPEVLKALDNLRMTHYQLKRASN